MCISASVSFATSAVLLSGGLYAVRTAARHHRPWLPLALLPMAFGVQQALEGGLWLALEHDYPSLLPLAAYGFLFFSHFFWPFWAPFSAYSLERDRRRRRLLGAVAVVGGLFGASLYVPLLLQGWLEVGVERGSIVYQTRLVYDGLIPRDVVRGIYALIVLPPFLISTSKGVRTFGAIVAISVLVAYAFFYYAFISLWCLFAAWISLLVVYLIYRRAAHMSAEKRAQHA